MKISIALTLIITIAVFSFISGYSISAHNKMNPASSVASQTNTSNRGTATAGEYVPEPSGGYGSLNSEKDTDNRGSAAGYGTPSPGYGQ